MQNKMIQIKKHKRAIKVLKMIKTLNKRILANEKTIALSDIHFFKGMKEHYENRVKIDIAIKKRLLNYYKNNFKI